jgi:hypothetical protein
MLGPAFGIGAQSSFGQATPYSGYALGAYPFGAQMQQYGQSPQHLLQIVPQQLHQLLTVLPQQLQQIHSVQQQQFIQLQQLLNVLPQQLHQLQQVLQALHQSQHPFQAAQQPFGAPGVSAFGGAPWGWSGGAGVQGIGPGGTIPSGFGYTGQPGHVM